MSLRRTLFRLLLALALLLAQQAMLAHAVSHLGQGPANESKQLPHGKACDRCVLSAQLAGGITASSPSTPVVVSAVFAAPVSRSIVHLSHQPAFFDSRAPPRGL